MFLFGLLDPHFELLGIGALKEGGNVGRKIGIGAPRAVNLLREYKLLIVWLSRSCWCRVDHTRTSDEAHAPLLRSSKRRPGGLVNMLRDAAGSERRPPKAA